MNDNSSIIENICTELLAGDADRASEIARSSYEFKSTTAASRTYTPFQAMTIFRLDGFIDRYSGARLVFPGVLRLLARILPAEFPYQLNWKMAETHIAFWELFPTIDHILPIARGGLDTNENMVTTSMLKNSAKSNWTLKELNWELLPRGSTQHWDGLTKWFIQYVELHRDHLVDPYLRRWHGAAIRAGDVA